MSNPAFIVDGFTEKLVIGSLCPGKPVSRTDLNGKSVTIEAIANKVASLIRLFNNRHYPIIIIIDREQREESCSDLCAELGNKLIKLGLNDQDIRICFADRMFENWIIADWNVFETEKEKPDSTDGLRGSSEIKKILGSYHKTTEGVELFLKCDLEKVYSCSESFRNFVDSIPDINCNKLKFAK
ncbi:DUF4276 family protein [Aureibaculum sp. A20]|uniref:DUF4276 family protein n=1 Tax=Aureibaculum flavum TaxID=2795986 RepID=A0ABS0WWE3_9FLAO|nr:DUF4276 family protein [Aureibaculum flavum]MBJ2176285.1 DUF4276 family protein [Aureibaculum flavum]